MVDDIEFELNNKEKDRILALEIIKGIKNNFKWNNAAIEAFIGIDQRTIEKWERSEEYPSLPVIKLFKIIELCPWLLLINI